MLVSVQSPVVSGSNIIFPGSTADEVVCASNQPKHETLCLFEDRLLCLHGEESPANPFL